ncbi:MAG: hypothetical protein LLF83_05795 [Methanobacterium sp.]|nr:hypothetical protein [Methanobacterium sp.]
MAEIKVLEFGYSLESARYFIKFLIKGVENKEKFQAVLGNIPDGNMKRFEIEENPDGFIVLERFNEEEYPFNKEIPSEKEIISVEETVKGFLSQLS